MGFWETLAVPVVLSPLQLLMSWGCLPFLRGMFRKCPLTFRTLAGRSHSVARSFLLLESYRRLGTLLEVKK